MTKFKNEINSFIIWKIQLSMLMTDWLTTHFHLLYE